MSQMLIQVSSIFHQPGMSLEVSDQYGVDDNFGTVVAKVADPKVVNADLRIDSLREGMLVTGELSTNIISECVRCLTPIQEHVSVEIDELYEYPDGQNRDIAEDELNLLVSDQIDLLPLFVDNLVPAFPFQPLCKPDCLGLCATCGERLDDGQDHDHELLDPRWAALSGLRAQLAGEKEVSTPVENDSQND